MRTRNFHRVAAFSGAIVFICLTLLSPVIAEQRTLSGTINSQDQFVSNKGDTYEIADTEAGMQLLTEAAGRTVMVTGDVVEDEEINFIMVESYTISSSATSTPAGTKGSQGSHAD
jgi:hypothetical protein